MPLLRQKSSQTVSNKMLSHKNTVIADLVIYR